MTVGQIAGFIAVFFLALIPASIWVGSLVGDLIGAGKGTKIAMSFATAFLVAYGAVFDFRHGAPANDCADLMRSHAETFARERCTGARSSTIPPVKEKAPEDRSGAWLKATGPGVRLREALAHGS